MTAVFEEKDKLFKNNKPNDINRNEQYLQMSEMQYKNI